MNWSDFKFPFCVHLLHQLRISKRTYFREIWASLTQHHWNLFPAQFSFLLRSWVTVACWMLSICLRKSGCFTSKLYVHVAKLWYIIRTWHVKMRLMGGSLRSHSWNRVINCFQITAHFNVIWFHTLKSVLVSLQL